MDVYNWVQIKVTDLTSLVPNVPYKFWHFLSYWQEKKKKKAARKELPKFDSEK